MNAAELFAALTILRVVVLGTCHSLLLGGVLMSIDTFRYC